MKNSKKFLSLLLCAVLLLGTGAIGCGGLTDVLSVKASAAPEYSSGVLKYTVTDGEATVTGCKPSAEGAVTIPSTLGGKPVTTIGFKAFRECANITEISVPDSVKNIEQYAFWLCTNLKKVNLPDGLQIISDSMFRQCSSLESITIPESVTIIDEHAFNECSALKSIVIPDSVTNINLAAFNECSNLTSVTFGSGLTDLGGLAFYDCTKLTDFTLPDSLTSIGTSAFTSCESIKSVNIPANVSYIAPSAFELCTSLENITVDENSQYFINDEYGVLFSAGESTLYQYPVGNKRTSYTIPSRVTMVRDYAFDGCRNLTITIPRNLHPSHFGDFGTAARFAGFIADPKNNYYSNDEFGVLFNKDKSSLLKYPADSTAAEYTIPDSVTSIETDAFSDCTNLQNIFIPDSVTSIGGAFSWCTGLTSITLPEGIKKISRSTFMECTNLKSVIIPDGVTEIGWSAFFNCTNLRYVHIPSSVTYIEEGILDRTSAYICSDTADCFAKTYAELNGIKFRVCTTHDDDSFFTDTIKNFDKYNNTTQAYRSSFTFTADIPEGGSAEWTVSGANGSRNADGSFTVKEAKSDFTVTCTVKDSSGKVISIEKESIKIKHSFWDKLTSFFKLLFNKSAYTFVQ